MRRRYKLGRPKSQQFVRWVLYYSAVFTSFGLKLGGCSRKEKGKEEQTDANFVLIRIELLVVGDVEETWQTGARPDGDFI